MPTLHRSCQFCISGKRRCDRAAPDCGRCVKKGVTCHYVNSPGQTHPRGKEQRGNSQAHLPVDRPDEVFYPKVIRTCDAGTLQCLRVILSSFVEDFLKCKSTAFIRLGLYEGNLPSPLSEARDLLLNTVPQGCDSRVVQHTITDLIHTGSQQASYLPLLVHAQSALILSLSFLLSSSNPYSIDTEALWAVTHRLWEERPSSVEGSSPWKAWLLAESVRRTILVCNVLLRTWQVMKQGYAVQSLCIEALPFDSRMELWETKSENMWQELVQESVDEDLVSVAEFVKAMGDARGTGSFGELILLAFKDTTNHVS